MFFLSFSLQSSQVLLDPCKGATAFQVVVYLCNFGCSKLGVGKNPGNGNLKLGLALWCSKVVWSRSDEGGSLKRL